MITWVRIERSIGEDPKVHVLAERLGLDIDAALGKLVRVFAAMAEHAQDGDLSEVPVTAIELWANWTGKRGKFDAAFRELYATHGVVKAWERLNGAAIAKAERDAERKVAKRAADKRATEGEQSRDRRGNGAKTARAESAAAAGDVDVDGTTSLLPATAREEPPPDAPTQQPEPPPDGLLTRLVRAANRGVSSVLGEQTQPILSGHPDSYEFAKAVALHGIPPDFAESHVWEIAKRNAERSREQCEQQRERTGRPSTPRGPRTMAYFTRAVIEAWQGEQSRADAANGTDPAPVRDPGTSGYRGKRRPANHNTILGTVSEPNF